MYMKLLGIKVTIKNLLIGALVLALITHFFMSSNILGNIETMQNLNQNPDKLTMFDDSKFKPECCPSIYSSDNGCVCTTANQRKFFSKRGNNKTSPSEI